jgi:putative flavoprotein involved in K+ transport
VRLDTGLAESLAAGDRAYDDFTRWVDAPVREQVDVRALEAANGDGYRLRTDGGDVLAHRVVLAAGPFQEPRLPAWAGSVPAGIAQLHSSAYKNAAHVPDGAVLVVGAGPSGQQIAEDLLRAGRGVFLSVGRHRRVPRRYRGRDHYWWLEHGGFYERTTADVPPEQRRGGVAPALTGVDGGHDLDLRRLHADGAVLLGRALGVDAGVVRLDTGLAESLAAGDRAYDDFTRWVDARLVRFDGLYGEPEPRERHPDPPEPPAELDLAAAGISTLIWATGFRLGYADWVRLPVFDEDGRPVHERGATASPGVYFLGLHWLHRQRSAFIRGAEEDARHLAALIAADAAGHGSRGR